MADSVVGLVNNSLALIGAAFITTLDQDTKAAQTAKQIYPSVRDAVLRAFTWNCATKQIAPGVAGDTPVYGWAYCYQLPADCLRVVRVYEEVEWRIMGRKLYCDSNVIHMEYIYRVEDVTQWDVLLSSAVEARLASELAFAVLESKTLRDDMWAMYKAKLGEAKGVDSREQSSQEIDSDVWISSRTNGGSEFPSRSNR